MLDANRFPPFPDKARSPRRERFNADEHAENRILDSLERCRTGSLFRLVLGGTRRRRR